MLSGLNHGLTDTVFDARKGIKEFAFDIDVGIQTGSCVIDFNERGVTHGISDRFEFFAHT